MKTMKFVGSEYAGDFPIGSEAAIDIAPKNPTTDSQIDDSMRFRPNASRRHTAVMGSLFLRVRTLFNFCDLPVRKKFLLYSVGAVLTVLGIALIGLLTMFDMSSKSQHMVERIWPQEKTANIVIRKLRGANISIHNMAIFTKAEVVHADFRRAKATLEDSRLYLDALLQGGRIADRMLATNQTSESYRVFPVDAADKKEEIAKIIEKINELGLLTDEVLAEVENGSGSAANLRGSMVTQSLQEKISRYDALTRDSVTMLNNYAINVSKEWGQFALLMKQRFSLAILLISISLCLTLALATLFGAMMSASFESHLNGIIGQIRSLSSGELDLTKKIAQTSKDELGTLSNELNKLMDAIGSITTFKKVIEGDESAEDIYLRLGKIFHDEFGIHDCVIYEVPAGKKTMDIVYPPDARGMELMCKPEVQLDCELCRAKRTGMVVSSRDFPGVCRNYAGENGAGHLCIPVTMSGNVGAVVQLVCNDVNQCDKAVYEGKVARVKQYLGEAQPVLEAKRLMQTLKDTAVRDGLTGLYNRRFLEECSTTLVAGTQRRKATLGILMCDLDFFKETNDTYGHDAGDIVLKETAHVIRNNVRASDMVIRFGGEEFLVLLTDADSSGILESAEKIRVAIEANQVRIPGGFVKKTISIGASEFPGDTQNFWKSIKFADVALYKAKEAGRNRALRFSRDMWNEEHY